MNRILVVIMLAITAVCCHDVLEENIEDSTVNLRAPQDASTITPGTVTLWWDPVEGATEYNVQVVKPNQAAPEVLVKDTVITANQLKMKFNEGEYEWCVRGKNSAYVTAFSCRELIVEP